MFRKLFISLFVGAFQKAIKQNTDGFVQEICLLLVQPCEAILGMLTDDDRDNTEQIKGYLKAELPNIAQGLLNAYKKHF